VTRVRSKACSIVGLRPTAWSAYRYQPEKILGAYGTPAARRSEVIELASEASVPIAADAMAWITSHSFRKTTATILDDAGQTARQIADQLGHARPSLTQDVYMGRKAKNPAAAEALETIADDL
jgi:integrase